MGKTDALTIMMLAFNILTLFFQPVRVITMFPPSPISYQKLDCNNGYNYKEKSLNWSQKIQYAYNVIPHTCTNIRKNE